MVGVDVYVCTRSSPANPQPTIEKLFCVTIPDSLLSDIHILPKGDNRRIRSSTCSREAAEDASISPPAQESLVVINRLNQNVMRLTIGIHHSVMLRDNTVNHIHTSDDEGRMVQVDGVGSAAAIVNTSRAEPSSGVDDHEVGDIFTGMAMDVSSVRQTSAREAVGAAALHQLNAKIDTIHIEPDGANHSRGQSTEHIIGFVDTFAIDTFGQLRSLHL
jgi:hypothetical protein